MPKQRYTTEETIHQRRKPDVFISQGRTVADAVKQTGVTNMR